MTTRLWQAARVSLPGVWGGFVGAWLSFTPSLLPRAPMLQGVVVGVSALMGYAIGVGAAWLWREFADREPRTPSPRAWLVTWLVGAVGGIVALVWGARFQWAFFERLGLEHSGWLGELLVPVVGVGLFVVVLALARALRWAARALGRLLTRAVGVRAARAGAFVVVCGVALTLVSGVLWPSILSSLDSAFALGDHDTPRGVSEPTQATRSGSPESLVQFDTLGFQGRAFVGRGPGAADISEYTDEPALEPIRSYAGVASAADLEERARLAVDDLERAGGFERERLLVATPSGTGWVEPSSIASFEFLAGGDSATVAIQYSYLPSWMAHIVDHTRARDAGRVLFDEVYSRVSALPEQDRPELYVFGESLGSFGAEAAFSGESDLANRVDGALFVGPPSFNTLYRDLVVRRDEGSPEIEPIYRQGRTIRFLSQPGQVPPGDAEWGDSRVLYMGHPSDPITWWSPDLLFQRPDWLEEPRGGDVPAAMRWIPLVTFWQVSADMSLGFSSPPGHGHNYTGDHVDGWAQVLGSDGFDTERLAELRRLIDEEHGAHNFS